MKSSYKSNHLVSSLSNSSSSVTSSSDFLVSMGDPSTSLFLTLLLLHLTSSSSSPSPVSGSIKITDFSLGVITSMCSYASKSLSRKIMPMEAYTISSGISNASSRIHENSVRNVDMVATTANTMVNTAQTRRRRR